MSNKLIDIVNITKSFDENVVRKDHSSADSRRF